MCERFFKELGALGRYTGNRTGGLCVAVGELVLVEFFANFDTEQKQACAFLSAYDGSACVATALCKHRAIGWYPHSVGTRSKGSDVGDSLCPKTVLDYGIGTIVIVRDDKMT